MTVQHTPGPWHVEGTSGGYSICESSNTIGMIAAVRYLGNAPGREAAEGANARLMAAAPALREALEHTDIALTNMLQLFSVVTLADGPRAKLTMERDRIRAVLAEVQP